MAPRALCALALALTAASASVADKVAATEPTIRLLDQCDADTFWSSLACAVPPKKENSRHHFGRSVLYPGDAVVAPVRINTLLPNADALLTIDEAAWQAFDLSLNIDLQGHNAVDVALYRVSTGKEAHVLPWAVGSAAAEPFAPSAFAPADALTAAAVEDTTTITRWLAAATAAGGALQPVAATLSSTAAGTVVEWSVTGSGEAVADAVLAQYVVVVTAGSKHVALLHPGESGEVVVSLSGTAAVTVEPAAAAQAAAAAETVEVADPHNHGRSLQVIPQYIPLTSGLIRTARVFANSWRYFAINTTIPFTRVDIVLTPLTGDPDMYVTVDGNTANPPSQTHFQYAATSPFGADNIIVRQTDGGNNKAGFWCNATTRAGQNCQILIGVYGFSPSNFTLVATLGGSYTQLIAGLPMIDLADMNSYSYYTFNPSIEGSRISIVVTPISGDPDLFVGTSARGQTRPQMGNTSSYCWLSTTARRDAVEIEPTDRCYCAPPCTYYVGVLGYQSAAIYTILAFEEAGGPETLVDGVPQAGFVAQSTTDQYVFNLEASSGTPMRRTVEFALSPYSGDPDLYITLNGDTPGPSRYDYASLSSGGVDYVLIRSTDRQWQRSPCAAPNATCNIRIAVHAFSSSFYQIVAAANRMLLLDDGVPMTDYVDAGYYNYYRFPAADYGYPYGIYFTVTPLAGDPDLYIGNDAVNGTQRPTSAPGTYIWRAVSLGTESVFVGPNFPRACVQPCNYYIGVLGYGGNATFSIMARSASALPVQLSPGVPVLDVVPKGAYNRYTAVVDRNLGFLEITVSPQSGDPDLYVAVDNRTVNRFSYQWFSSLGNGDDDVYINTLDVRFQGACGPSSGNPPPNDCIANIAVFGFSASQYTIVASNGLRLLQDSVTTTGRSPANKYNYFALQLDNVVPVTITVVPISGDPDIFVSVLTSQPNISNSQWQSFTLGVENIVLDPADPRMATCVASVPCMIYIGVYGWQAPTMYSITAATNTQTELTDGTPTAGTVAPGTLTYYSFLVNPTDAGGSPGAEMYAIPTSGGDVQVYVSGDVDETTGDTYAPAKVCLDPACVTYTFDHVTWSSTGSLDRQEVDIDPSDPLLQPPQALVIGVYSDDGATFDIMASTADAIKTLLPGTPTPGMVGLGAYNYYRLTLTVPYADLQVIVTPQTGDPDLYASSNSSNTKPSRTQYNKKANGMGLDAVTFVWLELTECQVALAPGGSGSCSIYLAVYGYTNATYTITGNIITNGTSATQLIDGTPQVGTVPAKAWAYYYANVNVPYGSTYSFFVRPTSGDPDLYVTTDGRIPTISPPHYQYYSNHYDGEEYVNVAPGTDGYNVSCTVFVGVYGYTATTYTVSFVSAAAVVTLRDGESQAGSGGTGSYGYYSFAVSNPTQATSFAITSLSGDPDLYASVWPASNPRFRPTADPSGHTWEATTLGSDTLVIQPYPTDPNACSRACVYIVGVYCSFSSACSWSITASASSGPSPGNRFITLVDGQPLSNVVPAYTYLYFIFDSGTSGDRNISMRAVATTGDVQLFVTNTFTPGEPPVGTIPTNQSGSYVWSSTTGGGAGSGAVWIPYNDPKVLLNATLYTIAVYGAAPTQSSFTITAATQDVPTTLVPGQPSTRHFVPQGMNQHYVTTTTDRNSDLVVVASVLEGSVTIGVSARVPTPDCTSPAVCPNATWISTVAGKAGDVVRVYAPRGGVLGPCTGPYVNGGSSPACNGMVDWRPGRYYISVFGIVDTSYAVTAYTSSSQTRLVDGIPQQGATVSGNPAVYLFQTPPDNQLPDVRFSINADGQPLTYYINSCVSSACGPRDFLPGPGNFKDSGSVLAYGSDDVFETKLSPAYCNAVGAGGGLCNYFVAVYAPASCDPVSCGQATFTLVASIQSGRQPTLINYLSILNKVFSINGNIEVGASAIYELYLNQSLSADVTIDVEACGPGLPNVYTCNTNPPAGVPACSNPFLPSRASHTGVATTNDPTHPGVARIVDRGVQTNAYFVAVAAEGTPPLAAGAVGGGEAATREALQQWAEQSQRKLQNGNGNWAYQVVLSSGQAAYLWSPAAAPGGKATLTVNVVEDGTSVNVSWPVPLIGDQNGANLRPAAGVTYTLYTAPGGFTAGGNPSGYVPQTSCGLIRYSGVSGIDPISVPPGQTWTTISGLNPNAYYEFNILAACDRACWALNGVAPHPEAKEQQQEVASARALGSSSSSKTSSLAAAAALATAAEAAAAAAEEADAAARTPAARAATHMYKDALLGHWALLDSHAEAYKYDGEGKRNVSFQPLAHPTPHPPEPAQLAPGLARRQLLGAGVPGYVTQRVAYAVAGAKTGAGGAAPTTDAFPVSAIVGIAVAVVAVAGAGFACVRYRRARFDATDYQYSSLDISSAMDTVSTPAFTRTGGGGGGVFNSINSYLRSPSAGSRPKGGLADSGFSEVEDRVSSFM